MWLCIKKIDVGLKFRLTANFQTQVRKQITWIKLIINKVYILPSLLRPFFFSLSCKWVNNELNTVSFLWLLLNWLLQIWHTMRPVILLLKTTYNIRKKNVYTNKQTFLMCINIWGGWNLLIHEFRNFAQLLDLRRWEQFLTSQMQICHPFVNIDFDFSQLNNYLRSVFSLRNNFHRNREIWRYYWSITSFLEKLS